MQQSFSDSLSQRVLNCAVCIQQFQGCCLVIDSTLFDLFLLHSFNPSKKHHRTRTPAKKKKGKGKREPKVANADCRTFLLCCHGDRSSLLLLCQHSKHAMGFGRLVFQGGLCGFDHDGKPSCLINRSLGIEFASKIRTADGVHSDAGCFKWRLHLLQVMNSHGRRLSEER